ncbi:MAG: ATP-binding protein [Bacillota bacterium]
MKLLILIIQKTLLMFLYIIGKVFSSLPFIGKGLAAVFIDARKRIKRLFRFSITFKITVVYGFMLTLVILLTSSSAILGFRLYLIQQSKSTVVKNMTIASDLLKENPRVFENKFNSLSQQEDLIITVFNNDKKTVFTTDKENEKIPFLKTDETAEIDNQQTVVMNQRVTIQDQPYYIQLSRSLEKENLYTLILSVVFLAVNGIGIIIIILFGSKISRRMLSPIEKMTDTVKAISIQDLDTRLDISGSHDELKDLAETFNEMLDRIQDAYDRQNQFVSDASHELRTPISVIQGYANLLDRWGKDDRKVLEESIGAIRSESQNMKDLVEKLLFLARSDKNLQRIEKEKFSFNQLIEEVVRETKLIDTNHEIISENTEPVELYADKRLIKQALRVFIDNSVKYTPPGGSIRIAAFSQKNKVAVIIEDTGIGIPEEDIPYIFDRFYRSDKSRTKESGGHGLGLTIAKWVIDRHQGTIDVHSAVQKGTKITIYLPLST